MNELEARLEYERDVVELLAEKRKLEEQLQNAIVPKFKVGQTVFVPITGRLPQKVIINAVHYDINELPPLQITYDVVEKGTLYEGIPECYIFAPREETQKTLAEVSE